MRRNYLKSSCQLAGAAVAMIPTAGSELDGPVLGTVFCLLLLGSLFYLGCWVIKGAWQR